jgi:hypothetical protein
MISNVQIIRWFFILLYDAYGEKYAMQNCYVLLVRVEMNITLISADEEKWASGMRSISSVLRRAGHKTTMIFAGSSNTQINR